MPVIEFYGVRATLDNGVWTSDGKVEGIEISQMLKSFPLPDDGFQYFPDRDFAWVNYLSQKFPERVVVLENLPPEYKKDVIY